MAELQHLENGQFEVLISESMGQDENLSVRFVVDNADKVHTETEKVFKEVVVPRKKNYQSEVITYQMAMQKAAQELEDNAKGKR